jgi:hypothetical protein
MPTERCRLDRDCHLPAPPQEAVGLLRGGSRFPGWLNPLRRCLALRATPRSGSRKAGRVPQTGSPLGARAVDARGGPGSSRPKRLSRVPHRSPSPRRIAAIRRRGGRLLLHGNHRRPARPHGPVGVLESCNLASYPDVVNVSAAWHRASVVLFDAEPPGSPSRVAIGRELAGAIPLSAAT